MQPEHVVLPKYVGNLGSSLAHRCDWVRASFLSERDEWVTRCTFKFARTRYAFLDTADGIGWRQCKVCFSARASQQPAHGARSHQVELPCAGDSESETSMGA